ncbi:MAG: protease modulator HflC [Candidatus Omnitrophica bacterium]|nr:protease modulator HflC [Candidatus Omnitrophota bacterium]
MRNTLNIYVGLILIAFLFLGTGLMYTIDETQQVVLTQFGELVGKPKSQAGLYFKLPWQQANYFEKRILSWGGDANQIPTRDKRFIWVDTFARWRINDPLKFMQSVRTEESAQSRLDDIIDSSTRDVISRHKLIEAIRSTNRIIAERNSVEDQETSSGALSYTELENVEIGREELAKQILIRAQATTPQYGIELIDVRIKRINYVSEVRDKVYDRMISERKRAAEQFRSEGQGKKAEIEGQITKELQEINSEAYKKAMILKGKADAEAIKIYADAFNKDPDFYSFLKTLETYKKTMNEGTTLILSTENDFFQQLNGQWDFSKE